MIVGGCNQHSSSSNNDLEKKKHCCCWLWPTDIHHDKCLCVFDYSAVVFVGSSLEKFVDEADISGKTLVM